MKVNRVIYRKLCWAGVTVAVLGISAIRMEGSDNPAFSLSIRPQQSRVLALHEVLLDITLTNISNQIITITAFPPEEIYAVDLFGPDGQPVPPTEMGRAIMRAAVEDLKQPTALVDMRGFLSVTLVPRQTYNEVIKIDHMFGIAKPGGYTVRLRRKISEGAGTGESVSNLASFIVDYNPAVEKYAPVGHKEP